MKGCFVLTIVVCDILMGAGEDAGGKSMCDCVLFDAGSKVRCVSPCYHVESGSRFQGRTKSVNLKNLRMGMRLAAGGCLNRHK